MLSSNNGKPERVAIYCRVSSEDQAERQTIQGQLGFLRDFCKLYSFEIEGEYRDEGWSGAIPLDRRPDGSRLLEAAKAGKFSVVLIYRLDRLGRSLSALLDAHSALDKSGVTIRSATEPFDTSSPIGRFVFQLLGSTAELEKATITERTTMGRDRVAKTGRWTGGRIPFGYDLDEVGCLTPSERWVTELGMAEADVVRDLFRRIADGSNVTKEARRLNAAGVRLPCRYRGKEIELGTEMWGTPRLYFTFKNPTYKGCAVVRSKSGPVERPVPPLVTPELWDEVGTHLTKNRVAAKRNTKGGQYLLRGLVICGGCGLRMIGQTGGGKDAPKTYYRCQRTRDRARPEGPSRDHAGQVRADWLESLVWEDCKSFILYPGDALADAKRQLEARIEETAGLESQRRALLRQIADKEAERDRIMTLFRRNRITLDEAESQMEEIADEAMGLQQTFDALRAQADLAAAFEAHLSEANALLNRLRDNLDQVEREDDFETKRQIVELLVAGVTVNKVGTGRGATTEVTLRYSFSEPRVFDFRTRRPSELRCPDRRMGA